MIECDFSKTIDPSIPISNLSSEISVNPDKDPESKEMDVESTTTKQCEETKDEHVQVKDIKMAANQSTKDEDAVMNDGDEEVDNKSNDANSDCDGTQTQSVEESTDGVNNSNQSEMEKKSVQKCKSDIKDTNENGIPNEYGIGKMRKKKGKARKMLSIFPHYEEGLYM